MSKARGGGVGDPYGRRENLTWPNPVGNGPLRWKCKKCKRERRRNLCLHCNNTEPITDEKRVPGVVS